MNPVTPECHPADCHLLTMQGFKETLRCQKQLEAALACGPLG
jgi:hypothetical protein